MSTADLFRLQVHKEYAALDINRWILEIIQPKSGESLLDIGCGDGEQSLAMMKHLGPRGRVLGIDRSREAIARFERKIQRRGIKNAVAKRGDIDSLAKLIRKGQEFDVAMSNFALYYSKSVPEVLSRVKMSLTKTGRLFVSGPALHNNYELIELHCQAGGQKVESFLPRAMEDQVLSAVRDAFGRVETHLFRNPVTFPNLGELLRYWKSYYLYDSKIAKDFQRMAARSFRSGRGFVTVKEVIGILARP